MRKTARLLLAATLAAFVCGADDTAEAASQRVTFTGKDIMNMMEPAERTAYRKLRQELEDLRAAGSRYPKGSRARSALVREYEAAKADLYRDYGVYRGIAGKTVTLHGDPPPNRRQVLERVLRQRRSGQGGRLLPHWNMAEDGRLSGSVETPAQFTAAPALPLDQRTLEEINRRVGKQNCVQDPYNLLGLCDGR